MYEDKILKPLGHEDLMPSGKHKGLIMKDVPAKYYLYLRDNDMATKRIAEYIDANIEAIIKAANQE